MALTTQFGVDIAFTTQDMKLSIDDFSERFLQPAYATVANKIDYDGLQLFKQVFNEAGTPGMFLMPCLPTQRRCGLDCRQHRATAAEP